MSKYEELLTLANKRLRAIERIARSCENGLGNERLDDPLWDPNYDLSGKRSVTDIYELGMHDGAQDVSRKILEILNAGE